MDIFTITSAQYVYDTEQSKNYAIMATIDGVVMSVLIDSANRHYQAIQEWAAIDGNNITDPGE